VINERNGATSKLGLSNLNKKWSFSILRAESPALEEEEKTSEAEEPKRRKYILQEVNLYLYNTLLTASRVGGRGY
jgi:hypothetical protein